VSGRLLELQDNGGVSSPRATATGGAWVHAPPQGRNWKQRDLAQPLLLFLSLPAVTTTVTCKRRKNAIKVSVLPPRFRYALFWFLSFSWFVDFSSAGNRSGGWVASGYYLVIIVEETGGG
jgi:hypothetical protein